VSATKPSFAFTPIWDSYYGQLCLTSVIESPMVGTLMVCFSNNGTDAVTNDRGHKEDDLVVWTAAAMAVVDLLINRDSIDLSLVSSTNTSVFTSRTLI